MAGVRLPLSAPHRALTAFMYAMIARNEARSAALPYLPAQTQVHLQMQTYAYSEPSPSVRSCKTPLLYKTLMDHVNSDKQIMNAAWANWAPVVSQSHTRLSRQCGDVVFILFPRTCLHCSAPSLTNYKLATLGLHRAGHLAPAR